METNKHKYLDDVINRVEYLNGGIEHMHEMLIGTNREDVSLMMAQISVICYSFGKSANFAALVIVGTLIEWQKLVRKRALQMLMEILPTSQVKH